MSYYDDICEDLYMDNLLHSPEANKANDENYIPSSTDGDYSPSNPWDAPGMSIRDFI
jgi:hypothetical protein